jgi:hypothetical protein
VLQKHFEVTSLKGFGIENSPEVVMASGAAIHF